MSALMASKTMLDLLLLLLLVYKDFLATSFDTSSTDFEAFTSFGMVIKVHG